jgi:DNA-binding transcriptional ArsR family regulator
MSAAASMLKPVRLDILEQLDEPNSATGLSSRLGLSRQRLNYHLRQLEKAGLVRLVEERRKGNCTERLYRATSRHFLIAPGALGPVAPPDPEPEGAASARDRFSWSYVVAVLGRALRDLTTLRRRADRADQRLATFALDTEVRLASPRALAELSRRLSRQLAELVAEYHDESSPRGRRYRLFLGSYPAVTKKGDEDE